MHAVESVTHGQKPATAVVVTIQRPEHTDAEVDSSLNEMRRLAWTAGIEVVDHLVQKRSSPSHTDYLGSGKLGELIEQIGSGDATDGEEDSDASEPAVDLVIVDDQLTPRQHRTLERALRVEVLDRNAVILEIFERRAQTREARLEVELARLRYELPRRRDDHSKGDRRGGGGRGARGNTNVELDKARIRERIAALESQLEGASQAATAWRERRDDIFQVALVGYTNAGKSSLMRALTASEVLVEDKLFATLGTTARQLQPPVSPPIQVSDTVGFIKHLPHELVASFRSTLHEASEADLLLLVVDGSDPDWPEQFAVTRETLASIGASDLPTQLVINKVDAIEEDRRDDLCEAFPNAVQISALDPQDAHRLTGLIVGLQHARLCEETLFVPHTEGSVLRQVHERGAVVSTEHTSAGTVLRVLARSIDLDRWRSRLSKPQPPSTVDDLVAVASKFGLQVLPDVDAFDESGLDFRVVEATDEGDRAWMLRAPRRPDVFASSRTEGRALRLLRERLPFEVPHWRLHTPELIAYPRLSGTPAWSVTDDGLHWNHLDPAAPTEAFLRSVAEALVALQSVSIDDVRAAGLPVRSLEQIRATRSERMQKTREALSPSDELWARWTRWLETDANWPTHAALTHGDLHPGHMLLDDDGRLTGIIDWTEVALADPAQDLVMFFGIFGAEVFRDLVARLERTGGRIWPGIDQHVAELWSFIPVEMAAWALDHDHEGALSHARSMLTGV